MASASRLGLGKRGNNSLRQLRFRPMLERLEDRRVLNAPDALADSYLVTEDVPLYVGPAEGVLANDSDPEGNACQAVLVSGPSNGTLTLRDDGAFDYTPNQNFVGSDSFTYYSWDMDEQLASNLASVTLTVDPVNDQPVPVDDFFVTDEDTPLVVGGIGVLANDFDPDDSMLNALIASTPSHGTLDLNADGSFTYTPEAHFSGEDRFCYVAVDASGDLGQFATVVITVNARADAPSLMVADAAGFQDQDIPLSILADLADTDGSEGLYLTISGVPSGASLSHGENLGGGTWLVDASNLGNLSIVCAQTGTFTLSVTATAVEGANGDLVTSQAFLTLTVV